MYVAYNYDEWKAWAEADDRRTGADRWKARDQTRLYDYAVIRRRHDELVEIRRSGDPHRLLYYLNEGVHGNMGGMGSPALYSRARFGTKELVTRHCDELASALRDLAEVDDREIPFAEKHAFFRRAKDCFGQSALMLSGAGSLGAFHLGVVKALAEQDLVPSVISGASAGAMIAAIVGTHPTDELASFFSDFASSFSAFIDPRGRSWTRRRLQLDHLVALVEATIPDVTFIEAFELTGRHLNVSVAPAALQQRSRLLNAITSPNAMIREAVMASCAIPGVFPAVTLAARGSGGERCPYIPSRKWVDGSITDDLPARRIARLYGVNHFISSQANPIVLWALQDPHLQKKLLPRLASIWMTASRDTLRAMYPFTLKIVRNVHPLNTYFRLLFGVMTQEYTADINILPTQRVYDPMMLLAQLTTEEAQGLLRDGEVSTWPKIEMIRNCTKISRCIEAMLVRFERRERPLAAVPIAREEWPLPRFTALEG